VEILRQFRQVQVQQSQSRLLLTFLISSLTILLEEEGSAGQRQRQGLRGLDPQVFTGERKKRVQASRLLHSVAPAAPDHAVQAGPVKAAALPAGGLGSGLLQRLS